MDLSIVVPYYNEVENIPKLELELLPVVKELAATRSVEIVFVDDGSADGGGEAMENAFGALELPNISLKFERHDVNRGLGAAIRTGFAAASGEVIVTTDSDGTYRFSTLPLLLEHLRGDTAIVTASPYHPQGGVVGVPAYRLILSQGSSLIYRLLVDWRIHTYTCLYRAYRREIVEQIPFYADGFLAGTELMVKAMLAGYRVAEFPAVLHRRAYGVSKAKLMRTIQAHLRFQGQVLLHRLRLANILPPGAAAPSRQARISAPGR